MASGENLFSGMMSRRMPVLAQSQSGAADPSNPTPNTTTSTPFSDPTQPGLGLNANNLSQAAYFPNNTTSTSESVGSSVVTDILSDMGAGALLIVCPECEAAALVIEIGGNLLGAAEAYYGARGNLGPTSGGGTQGSNP